MQVRRAPVGSVFCSYLNDKSRREEVLTYPPIPTRCMLEPTYKSQSLVKSKSRLPAFEATDIAALERWNQDLKIAECSSVITFENVNERAIDIVMAVLINSDVDFRQWLASQVLGGDSADLVHFQARWGVCYGGEADMVWFLFSKNQRTALMFENKINCGPARVTRRPLS